MPSCASVSSAALLSLAMLASPVMAAPTNIALGAAVTSNTAWYSSNTPTNIADGSSATRWVASSHGTATTPLWATIDLANLSTIETVELYWKDYESSWSGYSNTYTLSTSLDNVLWTTVGGGTFLDLADVANRSAVYDFAQPLTARYVRYSVTGGSHWANLAEMSVLGNPQTPGNNAVPEPGSLALLGLGLIGLVGLRRR